MKKKILAILIAFMMFIPTIVSAYVYPTLRPQTIHLHKMMYKENKPTIKNTGEELTIGEDVALPYDKSKYGDVTFTVYNIEVEDKSETNTKAIIEDIKTNGVNANVLKNAPVLAEVDVNDNGIATFTTNGDEDTLAIVETKSANGYIVSKADPIILYLPVYKNPKTGESVLENVHIYPKNEVTDLNFTLTKYGENKPLANAIFQLYKGEVGKGEPVGDRLTTTSEGTITVNNIIPGDYYFVELPSEVSDYSTDKPYLIGSDAKNDENNILKFSIPSTGIDKTKLNIKYTNYEKPSVRKTLGHSNESNPNSNFGKNDKVKYTSIIKVPTNINGGTTTVLGEKKETLPYGVFYYSDTLGTGLTFNNETNLPTDVTLTSNWNSLTEGVDYVLTSTGNNSFKIDFITNNGKVSDTVASLKGREIKLEYSVYVSMDAPINVDITNDAKLTFLNKPKVDGENDELTVTNTTPDDAKFKLYGIKFKKIDKGAFGLGVLNQPLKGAKFIVSNYFDETLMYYTNNKEELWTTDKSKAYVYISGEDGTFEVTGLREGSYDLIEIEAPDGYLTPDELEGFTITKTSYTERPTEITNTKLPEMPMTGSEKLLIALLIGFAVTGVGVIVAFKKKKNRV